ncbi:MAG TPA: hypothetical protein ENJ82_00400 [Bacteroidetes bacterium]|nr:hypothetical protein [Bacteroidota bacterium]
MRACLQVLRSSGAGPLRPRRAAPSGARIACLSASAAEQQPSRARSSSGACEPTDGARSPKASSPLRRTYYVLSASAAEQQPSRARSGSGSSGALVRSTEFANPRTVRLRLKASGPHRIMLTHHPCLRTLQVQFLRKLPANSFHYQFPKL